MTPSDDDRTEVSHPADGTVVTAPSRSGVTAAGVADSDRTAMGDAAAAPAQVTAPPTQSTQSTQATQAAPPAPRGEAGPIGIGTVLGHTYRVEAVIGRGGMGQVFRATHEALKTEHAVKVIVPELAENQKLVDLFIREAAVLRQVRHDGVVAYDGINRDEFGRLFLVMEFVDGPSLSRVLKGGPLPESQVAVLLDRVAAGLAAAHAKGVVHRDISPDNIILTGGRVDGAKIIDFGISKQLSPEAVTIIGDAFAGKYSYASPEQLGMYGGQVDARSDIYAVGLVLAQAALGRRLDMGDSPQSVILKRQSVPDLAGVPPRLRAVLERMLTPDPKDRPASIASLIGALGDAAAAAKPIRAAGSKPPVAALVAAGVALAAVAGGAYIALKPADPVTLAEAPRSEPAPVVTPAAAEAPAPAAETPAPPAQTTQAEAAPVTPPPAVPPSPAPAPATAPDEPPRATPAVVTTPDTPVARTEPEPAAPTPPAAPPLLTPVDPPRQAEPLRPATPEPAPPPVVQPPVVQPPVAPPQVAAVPQAPPDPAVIRARLEETWRGVSCSGLEANQAGDRFSVGGFVGSEADARAVRERIARLDLAAVDTAITVRPRPFCDVLSFASLRSGMTGPAAERPRLALNKTSGVFAQGETLKLTVTAGSRGGYLTVDYFDQLDGSVVHMLPMQLRRDGRIRPGQTLTLGADPATATSEERYYTVSPPFGPGMIVATITDEPLFQGLRPEVEKTAEYLEPLRAALSRAGAAKAESVFFETKAR